MLEVFIVGNVNHSGLPQVGRFFLLVFRYSHRLSLAVFLGRERVHLPVLGLFLEPIA